MKEIWNVIAAIAKAIWQKTVPRAIERRRWSAMRVMRLGILQKSVLIKVTKKLIKIEILER